MTVCAISEMADEVLFEFLHMEIVSHVYKEQKGSKGDMDNKVGFTPLVYSGPVLHDPQYNTIWYLGHIQCGIPSSCRGCVVGFVVCCHYSTKTGLRYI